MLGCWVINDNKLGISGNLYFPTGGSLAQDIPVMGFLYLKMACSSNPPRETKYEPRHNNIPHSPTGELESWDYHSSGQRLTTKAKQIRFTSP